MPPIEPSRVAGRLQPILIIGPIGAATLALFAVCGDRVDPRKTKVRVERVAQVVAGMNATTPVDPLSMPTGSAGACIPPTRTRSRPTPSWVSEAVAISRLHQVVIGRLGGLYGP